MTLGINLFALDKGDRMPYLTEEDGITPSTGGSPFGGTTYGSLNFDASNHWSDSWPTRPSLAFHLKPFLANDRTLVNQGTSKSLVMVCPSFTRNPQYVSRSSFPQDPNQNRRMFRLRKYVDGSRLWAYDSPKLGSIRSPSSNGAIADHDRKFPGGPQGIGSTAWKQLPDEPVHGGTRNYGFLDGHVLAVSAGDPDDQAHYKETVSGTTRPYGWLTATK